MVAVDFHKPLALWDLGEGEVVVVIKSAFLGFWGVNLHAMRVFCGDKAGKFRAKFKDNFLAAVRAVVVGDDAALNGWQNAMQAGFERDSLVANADESPRI